MTEFSPNIITVMKTRKMRW